MVGPPHKQATYFRRFRHKLAILRMPVDGQPINVSCWRALDREK